MSHPLIQAAAFAFFFLTYVGAFLCVATKNRHRSILLNFSLSFVLWYGYLVILTEGLSVFEAIGRKGVYAGWIVFLGACVVILLISRKEFIALVQAFCSDFKAFCIGVRGDFCSCFLLLSTVVVLLKSTFLAVTTVPNNWDSMTYHLSRIMYWIEHRTLAFFYTPIDRQLWVPGFAEYVNLHTILLCDGDFFVNLLQNLSAYGCVILLFGILRKYFRRSVKVSLMAAFLVATMNQFFAESATTQTDVVSAFVLLSVITIVFEFAEQEHLTLNRYNTFMFLVMGLGCGIMYGVKSNAAVPLGLFALTVLIYRITRKDRLPVLLLDTILAAVAAVLTALPVFLRNYLYYGDILAKKYSTTISIGTGNPAYVFVNVLKNISTSGTSKWNADILCRCVCKIAEVLGVDVNAPSIRFEKNVYSLGYSVSMDNCSAAILTLLILSGTVVGICRLVKHRAKEDVFAGLFILQFYVTTAIVRWQPWVVRLLIPTLLLASIASVYFMDVCVNAWINRRGKLAPLKTCIMVLVVFVSLTGCQEVFLTASIKSHFDNNDRFDRYFYGHDMNGPYSAMCTLIDEASCDSIGFYTGHDSYQYPVLARYYGKGVRIENVMLGSEQEAVAPDRFTEGFVPDAVIVADHSLDADSELYWNGAEYRCKRAGDRYSLWTRESHLSAP